MVARKDVEVRFAYSDNIPRLGRSLQLRSLRGGCGLLVADSPHLSV